MILRYRKNRNQNENVCDIFIRKHNATHCDVIEIKHNCKYDNFFGKYALTHTVIVVINLAAFYGLYY